MPLISSKGAPRLEQAWEATTWPRQAGVFGGEAGGERRSTLLAIVFRSTS
jgi:hypothetical protein